jgi:hypothetical protein
VATPPEALCFRDKGGEVHRLPSFFDINAKGPSPDKNSTNHGTILPGTKSDHLFTASAFSSKGRFKPQSFSGHQKSPIHLSADLNTSIKPTPQIIPAPKLAE